MNRPRRRSKKDSKLKSVQTSTPILGKLTGEKFPSFKRLSIIKAQSEWDIRGIQSLQENKRRKKKSLSISGIYKDTSDQLLEARQRFIKREESDSFTRVFYKRASVEQRSLLLSNDNCDPFQQSRRFSKECRFSLDDGSKRRASKSGLGGKIRSSVSSDRKGRDYVGALTDVGNFQGDVSDPEVVSEALKGCENERSGIKSRKEAIQSVGMEKKLSKKKRRASRTRNLTSGRVVRRKPTRETFNGKEALKVIKRSSSGKGYSVECTEEIKSNHSDASEKDSKTSNERKGNLTNGRVLKEEPTSENVRSKEVLKVIVNACFGTRSSTQRTKEVENRFQDTDGKENGKINTLRKRKNTDGLSRNPPRERDRKSEMNKSTPVNKRAGSKKKGGLKKKLWNDPLTEKNLPLIFLDLDESEKINEETETDEKTKTSSEMNASSSNANTFRKEFEEIMEESNEFMPPPSRQPKKGPKRQKNTVNRGIFFKKPPQERLLSKVLRKSVKNLSESTSDDKENGPYPSTSTPLDSPVSDCKSMPALFHGLSPVVLERPIGFSSTNEPSCVNVTYSKANHAAKESKLDLMWHSFLNLESNSTFVKNTSLEKETWNTERKEEEGGSDDDIRLFESPPRTLPPAVGRSGSVNQRGQPSHVKEEVEETLQHAAAKSQRDDEGEHLESSRESPVSDGVLEKFNRNLEELSDWKLCCESVPYSRHDHLLN